MALDNVILASYSGGAWTVEFFRDGTHGLRGRSVVVHAARCRRTS